MAGRRKIPKLLHLTSLLGVCRRPGVLGREREGRSGEQKSLDAGPLWRVATSRHPVVRRWEESNRAPGRGVPSA